MIHHFQGCELDPTRVVLRRDGQEIHVEPQVFDLLLCLVEHRGHVVRKEELLDLVWGDRFVSDSALTTRIKSARQAVGDDGTRQSIIRTVHGRGYEFVADVTTETDHGTDPVTDEPSVPVEQAHTRPSVLPSAIQPLIGRDGLLDRLEDELGFHRLITLVGTGGVGKTSVAYELARRVEHRYRDGINVVELVTVVDEESTFEAFATALDVSTRQQTSIDESIIEMLRSRQRLLLLDNCEHLIDPVASLVTRIMRSAPDVSIVATSREPLAIAGEHVWTVEPLATVDRHVLTHEELAAVPAIALFIERAQSADPAFRVDDKTAASVVEICRRLDGIPLAIELAASRARSIDVAEIAHRLDQRFRILKAVRRGSDPRHRTLDDAISWSYDLLPDDEKWVFRALAVFAGQFELADAEAVCRDDYVLDQLTRLAERSMLVVRRPPDGGTRYELLETLREYGRNKLDDNQRVELQSAHTDHVLSLSKEVRARQQTSDEGPAVARADASFAEFRSAQRFATQIGDFDLAFELIGSIHEYAMRTLRYEVFAWADATSLAAEGVGPSPPPLIAAIRAYGAWVHGDVDRALELALHARSVEAAQGAVPSGLVERVIANVCYTTGNNVRGLVEGTRMIDLALESGNDSRIAHACYMDSVAASSMGDFDDANHKMELARLAAHRTGSPTDLASAWVAQGFATRHDDDAALDAFDNADRLARAARNRWMSGFARTEACGLLVHRGDVDRGCEGLAELVDTWFRAGEWSHQWTTLTRCVIALERIGRLDLAAQAVGAVEKHTTLGCPPATVTVRAAAFAARQALDDRLGEERALHERMVGASSPVADVVHRTRNALLGRSTSS